LLSLLCSPHGLDLDIAVLSRKVVTETAPRPVLRLGAQAPGDRIAVDVAELLDSLARTENVEVIVASLPESFGGWPGLLPYSSIFRVPRPSLLLARAGSLTLTMRASPSCSPSLQSTWTRSRHCRPLPKGSDGNCSTASPEARRRVPHICRS